MCYLGMVEQPGDYDETADVPYLHIDDIDAFIYATMPASPLGVLFYVSASTSKEKAFARHGVTRGRLILSLARPCRCRDHATCRSRQPLDADAR